MRRAAHFLTVIGLLVGFYLLSLGLLAVLLVIDVLVTKESFHTPAIFKIMAFCYLATFGVGLIVYRAAFVSTRLRKPPGIAVTAAQEPLLWARVGELARIVGTRPPREIRLVPDVNAAVWEDTKLLGLIPGKRHMMIGVPLLLGLTRAQLDSVIAHELGHYSGRDTRAGALYTRTRATVVSAKVAAERNQHAGHYSGAAVWAALFGAYARLVLSVTQPAARAQEYAADRVAAQVGGRAAASAALREIPVLDAAFDFYLDRYVAPGAAMKALPLPAEVLGGFGSLLQDPERRAELDDLRAKPPKGELGRFDSHPPIAERIAAIAALPETGSAPEGGDASALTLLTNPQAALTGVGTRMLEEVSAGATGLEWDRLAATVGHTLATERANVVRAVVANQTGQPSSLGAFLGLVDSGRLDHVLAALPVSETAQRLKATGRVARELAKTRLKSSLYAWILIELAPSGRATWRHSWAQAGGVAVLPDELDNDLGEALAALLAITPDTAPLRAVLRRAGVPA
jgi:Zn-dependent protease with chaperone function